MFVLHLNTGGLIKGRRVEGLLNSLGINGSIEAHGPVMLQWLLILRRDERLASAVTDRARGTRVNRYAGTFQPNQAGRSVVDRWRSGQSRTGFARTCFGRRYCHRVDLNSEWSGGASADPISI